MTVGAKIVVNAIVLALSLTIVEGGLRLLATVTHRERGMRFDSELGWRPMPNVRKIGQVWGVTRVASSNSAGWRDRERSLHKTAGKPRLIALGDSMTFGVGVDDVDRFTESFERDCGKAEFLNLGVAGYGPDQELRLMETEGLRYQPDLVLVTISLVNDYEDVRHDVLYSWPKPVYHLENGRLVIVKPRRSWSTALRDVSYLYELAIRFVRNVDLEDHVASGMTEDSRLPIFQSVLSRMVAVAREHHVPLAIVLAYSRAQMASGLSETETQARDIVRSLGVPVLDASDFMAPALKVGRSLFVEDQIHWNTEGHRLVAKALCEWGPIQQSIH